MIIERHRMLEIDLNQLYAAETNSHHRQLPFPIKQMRLTLHFIVN